MKKKSLLAVAAVLSVGLGFAAMSSHGVRETLNVKQSDAAYRDGAYQAKIDVEKGRKAHQRSLGIRRRTLGEPPARRRLNQP